MIIQETTLVTLNSRNITHYESLGYFIPKYKDNFYRQKVKKGTKIKVKVSDLMKGSSKVKVLCKCDMCGKEKLIVFNTIKEKYICQKCNNNLPSFRENQIQKVSGINNIKWNWNLTDKERKIRHCIPGIKKFRREVLKRDNHTCQCCGSKDYLQAHHINNFSDFKEQRTDVDNGITLCFDCHKGKNGIHSLFGSFTTLEDLKIFLKRKTGRTFLDKL